MLAVWLITCGYLTKVNIINCGVYRMGMDKPKAIYSILKYSLGAVNESPSVDKVDSTLSVF